MVREGTAVATATAPRSDAGELPAWNALALFWLLDRLAPNSPEHRTVFSYRITGRFLPSALRTAWQAIMARHDVLRGVIADIGGRPVWTMAATWPGSFSLVDLTMFPEAERGRRAGELCAELAAAPISLADGPLARLTVLRLAPDDHRAVLVVHRAAADDRSLSLLTAELSRFYAQACLSDRSGLPGLPGLSRRPAQYADYVAWQREQPSGQLLDWWKATLTPPPPAAALPADWATAGPGGLLSFALGHEDLDRFCEVFGSEQVEAADVLLAALLAVLGRYGAQDRVPVCVPTSVRPAEFADVIGQFDNLLVVTGDLTGAPTFRDFAGRVGRAARAALEHRALPLATLAGALDIGHDPDRIPLGEVVFDRRQRPGAELTLPGAEVSGGRVGHAPARSDLVLTVRRSSLDITGTLAYRGGEPERAAATLVLDQLRTLLRAGLGAPDTPVYELPLDTAPRTAAIARQADRIGAGPPGRRPVPDLIRARSGAAVAAGTEEVSYARLLETAADVAARLRAARGVGVSGSPVAIRLPHGAPQLAASLGTWQAGGQLIWLNAAEAGERVRSLLAERRPACLLVAGGLLGSLGALGSDPLAAWYRDELGGLVIDVADVGPNPPNPSVRAEGPLERVPPDQVAYIAHTSGSTGKPKGIAQTHGALAQFVTWMAATFGLRPGSRVAQWVAADHDPSICEVFATLTAGGTLCPVPDRIRVNPEKFLAWLIAERITFWQTVPSFAREVLRAVRDTGAAGRLGALEWLVLMGEALPGELVRELQAILPGTRLANLYGPTETIAATWCEITPEVASVVGSVAPIGAPIPGREVLVLDEADRPCPTGVIGEIVIRGPHVADGYLGSAGDAGSLGDQAFRPVRGRGDAVRCYRTGDLARRRPDGLLEFRGRRDQQVKIQGQRLELAEVEAALAEHASVAECAVIARTDGHGLVSQLAAYVVPRRTPAGDPAGGPPEWRAHLRARFGRPMPVAFYALGGGLPRNVAGKIDRRGLPALGAQPTDGAAATPLEREVAELWSGLLGLPDDRGVGAHESFFTAGGHSVLLPELLHLARERFGVEIPLRTFFANPTVAAMSALIAETRQFDAR